VLIAAVTATVLVAAAAAASDQNEPEGGDPPVNGLPQWQDPNGDGVVDFNDLPPADTGLNDSTSTPPVATSEATSSPATTGSQPSIPENRRIEIQLLPELRFEPSVIAVEPGETVTLVLMGDACTHKVVLADSPDKNEILLVEDLAGSVTKEVTHTFPDQERVLYLYCVPHEFLGMTGTIVVQSSTS
jgi:plastocyanin